MGADGKTPRRNRMDLNHPSEKAIQDAIWETEKVGADPKLTKAVTLMGEAKGLVSDYLEEKGGLEKNVSTEEM